MTGQKRRFIKRFEKEAKIKDKQMRKLGMTCVCGKCNLAKFSLQEIKDIIYLKEFCECGHHTNDHSYDPDNLETNLECDKCDCMNFAQLDNKDSKDTNSLSKSTAQTK